MAPKKDYERFESQVRLVNRGILPTADLPREKGATRSLPHWQIIYSRIVKVSDLLVVTLSIFAAQLLWLPWDSVLVLEPAAESDRIPYAAVSAFIVLLWMLTLIFSRAYDTHVLALGDEEYSRVVRASGVTFMLVSAIAYWSKTELARGYVLIAIPVGMVLLVFCRWLSRRWLSSQWRKKRMRTSVVIIGEGVALETILRHLIKSPGTPYKVVGICDTDDPSRPLEKGSAFDQDFLMLPYADDISEQLREMDAETLVIVPGPLSSPERIRQIGWLLDQSSQKMLLAPGLTDVAGPRIAIRPAAGMPLMQIDPAGPSRLSRLTKRTFDFLVSLTVTILLSPIILITALTIKLTDKGPVFYKQERIGFLGKPFLIWKFRSMRTNSDQLEAELIAQRDAGNEVLFKMKDDPRITPIGKFIRRFSIDELPQLFNVIGGSMSLIGPRPPLPREVKQYEDEVYRKFLVKPGITGLWQVSGRSNLSWDESVRMDLYYVENWSFIGDLRILWRTAKAVVDGDGAY